MKSIWVATVCLMVLLGSVRPFYASPPVPDLKDLEAITVFSANTDWLAQIRSDGSAELSIGSSFFDSAKAPPQSIAFATIYDLVKPHLVSECRVKTCVTVTLRKNGRRTEEVFQISDLPTIRRIMEEVRDSAIAPVEHRDRFRQLLEENPLVPGDKKK
jgi:hypothetical protein